MATPYDLQKIDNHGDENVDPRKSLHGVIRDASQDKVYAEYKVAGEGLASHAKVTLDGRISISLDLQKSLPDLPRGRANDVAEFAVDPLNYDTPPRMNVVIMLVGSRGDVQPFLALGKKLREYGHRVRIATHGTFRSFVRDSALEFFDIGGDPKDLMSYMVKNPGLVPGVESMMNGDIRRKRNMVADILSGCWRACHEPDEESKQRFAADAIISNPPSFAHVHCAEALGIPLLLSFTMPWCATVAFPHPLVNVKQSNAERGLTNYLSYPLADIMTWQGLGEVINHFRQKTLNLEPLNLISGPGLTDRLRIPWTYCLSPSLVPKPEDWSNHVDIVGFYFLELATHYKPHPELQAFLAAGPPPIYIGFGSVTVEDPAAMTKIILEAVDGAGVRALVSAGWGGLGGSIVPKDIFMLGNIPHDWLFSKVCAVCHHGGAGTTAIGIRMGKPTIIVPFFGDQPFWGMMVYKAGAGPEPIPHTKLNAENLTEAIRFATSPGARVAAEALGEKIRGEDGPTAGIHSFHRHLPLLNMRCDLDPSRVAVWFSAALCLKFSAFAAQTLSEAELLDIGQLDLHRPKEYASEQYVTDPVNGGGSAIFWTITNYASDVMKIFSSPAERAIATTAIPMGVLKLITSVHQGFHNFPKLYGSEVREPEKVTNFESGLKAGGQALFHGYMDGITGLVREPIKGAREEGLKGALKGMGRGFINASILPAAGVLGFMAHPIEGALRAGRTTWGPKVEFEQQRLTRIADGVEEVRQSSKIEKKRLLSRFKDLASPGQTARRRKEYTDLARVALNESDFQNTRGTDTMASTSTSAFPPGMSSDGLTSYESFIKVSPQGEDHDETFDKDMERAMKLSLAEYHNYK